MSIYDLSKTQIKKANRSFRKTYYGKMVYLISYMLPAILFAIALLLVVIDIATGMESFYSQSTQIIIIFATFSFIIGNMYFHRELRHYVNAHSNPHEMRDGHNPRDVRAPKNVHGEMPHRSINKSNDK